MRNMVKEKMLGRFVNEARPVKSNQGLLKQVRILSLPDCQIKTGAAAKRTGQGLAADIRPVDCLAAAGGVVATRPLIVRASSKSLIETPRRVLHIEYTARMAIADSLELQVA